MSGKAVAAGIAAAQKMARESKAAEGGAGGGGERLFPNVPPTMVFLNPRLDFGSLLRLKFWDALLPAKWNLCQNLTAVLEDIRNFVIGATRIGPELTLTETEKQLMELSRVTELYPSGGEGVGAGGAALPSFGVRVNRTETTGKGKHAGKGYSEGYDKPMKTNWEEGGTIERATVVLEQMKEGRDGCPIETVLASCLSVHIQKTLDPKTMSLVEIEKHPKYYTSLFEWGHWLHEKVGWLGAHQVRHTHTSGATTGGAVVRRKAGWLGAHHQVGRHRKGREGGERGRRTGVEGTRDVLCVCV